MAEQKGAGSVDFGYNTGPEQQETIKGTAGRNIARTAVNVAERVLGAPANFAEGLLGLANAGIELLPGVQKSPLPETLHLPTSERIHEYVTEPIAKKLLPPEYLEPQGGIEDFADTAIKDFADFVTGGKLLKASKALKSVKGVASAAKGAATATKVLSGLGKAAQEVMPFGNTLAKVGNTLAKGLSILRPGEVSVSKAAMLSGLSNLASLGTKTLGYEKGTQEGVKVGTMLLASLGGPNTVAQHVKDLYKKVEEVVPPAGSTIPAKKLFTDVQKLQQEEISTGLGKKAIPEKKFLDKTLEDIRSKIDNRDNTIPVNETWKIKKELNNVISKLDPTKDKIQRDYAKRTVRVLNDALKGEEAEKKFPEFVKTLKSADEAATGFNNLSDVGKFLVGHSIIDDISNPFTKIVFYNNLGQGLTAAAKTAVGITGLRNTIVPMEMFIKSPAIRQYYYKAMQAAIGKNATAANKYIRKFDKEANKMYPGYEEGSGTVE